jgi:dephospho-CoA kinase
MSVQPVKKTKLKIGITGNIASGKSTAITYLKAKGYDVIDSDAIVRHLWQNKAIIQSLSHMFHRDLTNYDIKQAFNQEVFQNSTVKQQLEAYLHPKVYEEIEVQIKKAKTHVFIDIPLLFETSYENHLDAVILITVPKDIQLNRLMKRGLDKKQALERIHAFMDENEKQKKTPYIISGTLRFETFYQALEKEIDTILHEYH